MDRTLSSARRWEVWVVRKKEEDIEGLRHKRVRFYYGIKIDLTTCFLRKLQCGIQVSVHYVETYDVLSCICKTDVALNFS